MVFSDWDQPGSAQPDMTKQMNSSIRPFLPSLVAAFFSISVVVFVLGLYREAESIDELGLFNPIYMFLHTGQMTYPIYGEADSFTVHPPLHYFEIALLMKLGMPQIIADIFAPFCELLLAILVVSFSRLKVLVKVILVSALALTVIFVGREGWLSLRPELEVVSAAALALSLLETARVDNWNRVRLFFGAFMLTAASALHWFAICAFLGVGVYAIAAMVTLPRRQATTAVLSLVSGGLAFGIPYLSIYFIPQWTEIWTTLNSIQEKFGLFLGPRNQGEIYNRIVSDWKNGSVFQVSLPLAIIYAVKLPGFVFALVISIYYREIRLFVLAALPLCVFEFFLPRKNFQYVNYLYVEIFIAFVAWLFAVALVTKAILALLRVHDTGQTKTATIAFLATVALCAAPQNFIRAQLYGRDYPRVLDADIARAAAQDIVGPNAYVGGRLGVWYISGAHRWHDLSSDVLWPDDLTPGKVQETFSKLDVVVEHSFMSDETINNLGNSILAWYADGTLKLGGFIQLSNPSEGKYYSLINEIFLKKAAERSNLTGYVISTSAALTRFDEAADGPEAFVTFICPDKFQVGRLGRSTLMSMKKDGVLYTLLMAVVPWTDYLHERAYLSSSCTMKDEVRGILVPVDREQFVARHRASDSLMTFDARGQPLE